MLVQWWSTRSNGVGIAERRGKEAQAWAGEEEQRCGRGEHSSGGVAVGADGGDGADAHRHR